MIFPTNGCIYKTISERLQETTALKSKIVGHKIVGGATLDKQLSNAFSGLSSKKLSDKHDTKIQA